MTGRRRLVPVAGAVAAALAPGGPAVASTLGDAASPPPSSTIAGAAARSANGAAPATAAVVPYAPRVAVMIVGRTRTLLSATALYARPASVPAAGRRCAVAGGTPLAALEAARRLRRVTYSLRDFGSCSTNPADAASLFVSRIGPDLNRGRDGWVYKVGLRAGTTGAADPRGPFGTGARLRLGQRLTWFYCHMGLRGCQPTLALSVAGRVAPAASVRLGVRGYDDGGHARPIAGALVRLGGARALTGPDGTATLTAPTAPGRYLAAASARGTVAAFPVGVTIG